MFQTKQIMLLTGEIADIKQDIRYLLNTIKEIQNQENRVFQNDGITINIFTE